MKATLRFFIIASVMRYMQRKYFSLTYKYRDDKTTEHLAEIESVKADKKHLEELFDSIVEQSIDKMPTTDIEILDDPVLTTQFCNMMKYRQWKKEHKQ